MARGYRLGPELIDIPSPCPVRERESIPSSCCDRELHAAVEAHPSYALTKDATNPSDRADYIITADVEGSRVSLAVLPVVIRVAKAD